MKRIVLRQERITIKPTLKILYELILDNRKYTIRCTEIHSLSRERAVEEVTGFTRSKQRAEEIFKLLVDNSACVGTVEDIISDQMC